MVIVTKMTNGTLQTVRQVKPNGLSIMSQPLHMWKHIEHKHKGEMNMIKLDKICNQLEEIREKLETKIEDIYCKADEKGREPTEREEERIEEMQEEIGAIEDALDYLKDFCNPMW